MAPPETRAAPLRSAAPLEQGARDWLARADRARRALNQARPLPAALRGHLEALRNKRDTLATKLAAHEHHRRRGRARGSAEVARALRALVDACHLLESCAARHSAPQRSPQSEEPQDRE